jgi:hypothetical protein
VVAADANVSEGEHAETTRASASAIASAPWRAEARAMQRAIGA